MKFFDSTRQYRKFKSEIDSSIQRVLDHGQFILGPEVSELETELSKYTGTEHCVTVANGTDSLLLALMALKIGPGDEVITTPFTWVSTAEVILQTGAKPVFVDIDPDTFVLNAANIEAAITSRTKAILPVSLYGQMPDFKRINRIASSHSLTVIEDAAQSFGATRDGKYSCATSSIGSTSFFPTKPLGCYGDGGALFTTDKKLAETFRSLRVHGVNHENQFDTPGTNSRLDTLQAAILLVKLAHFDEDLVGRNQLARNYTELLKDICVVPQVSENSFHCYSVYTVRVEKREKVIDNLRTHAIPFSIYYPLCLHEHPLFSAIGYAKGDFPLAEQAAKEVLSLPIYPGLSEKEQEVIVKALKLSIEAAG